LEVRGKLARILDAVPEQIGLETSIDILGLDSLMLTDFQVWISRTLDVNVPLIKLMKGPSIRSLAADLLGELQQGASSPSDSQEAEAPEDFARFTLDETDGVRVLSPWLIQGRPSVDARHLLVCFHSMGVGASLFRSFLLFPPADCDILAVQTPGRENRLDEPVAESVDRLVEQLVPELLPHLHRPFVIWGHSFGGIVAVEVIRRLREIIDEEPLLFVVSGTIAPHLIDRWQHREVILKSAVAESSADYLISLSRYVDDPALIKAILPGLRRDFPLLSKYRFRDMAPLGCPITAFSARQDEVVYTDEIREWSRHTRADFRLVDVDGDHWFLSRNRDLIVKTIEEQLQALTLPAAEIYDRLLESFRTTLK
jgi:surfactin synthase thioesterase subunit